ncbi:hypothetical protein BAUCODRAFT_109268 [Baudoinia panamericana UAMH 10762]|uniref:Tyrosinase copper-binding domain-containing protein n=1 Tax=Baudoinia panamericana (strain UAMH 10762) TaxID=717646 RepID=M2MGH4_BAUPA|nr:uncharacterized protein BAUCODRAFT_109268 [Baudoinia panamericana UAMH 10762]EMC95731.1 hypothetical protein BAUCODRAFT_109268 [Baudoinia panamericana UAMH 10762]
MMPSSFPRLSHLAFAALAFPSLTVSRQLLHHRIEDLPAPSEQLLRSRQSQGSFEVVTGIQEYGQQPRLEIRQLQQNADLWNVYLLGLARFQATDQADKLSYYQIAGIHGRPYTVWDGVEPWPGITDSGHCTHVSNIFLPWHRPYLALYEQVLFQHIVEAVNQFPDGAVRQRYASAALSWRAPYWDWAVMPSDGQSTFPDSLTNETVIVTAPNGTMTISNPLYAYNFHPVNATDFYYNPFATWNVTMRFPTDWSSDAVSHDDLVAAMLDNNRVSFQDRLYYLFTNYDNFTEFSNEAWFAYQNITNADSLESLHDAVHSTVGYSGHMTFLDYSAFDPVFWLHHVMIDRVFAMWQAIYSDSYVEPLAAVEQTFDFLVGNVQDETSPLKPFHSDQSGGFWTSESVRWISMFGYTYLDLGNGSVSAVKANINRLYGGSTGSSDLSRRTAKHGHSHGIKAHNQYPSESNNNGQQLEYFANIISPKGALNGSYAVYIFMGDFGDSPAAWPLSQNLVGTHAVFATLSGADAASTQRKGSGLQVTGSIPLTSTLLKNYQQGGLSCMDVQTVTAYLKHNLHWRVAMFDGVHVPVGNLDGFTVTVVSAEVEAASAPDAFPKWGHHTVLANVTEGKPGGCRGS